MAHDDPETVAELQSWGKCGGECGQVIWVAPSIHSQHIICKCGTLDLHNGVLTGMVDPDFTVEDCQVYLDAEHHG